MDAQTSIKNRLLKNLKEKSKIAKRENLSAYRLYDRDIPEFPYIVDLYNEFVLIYEKTDRDIDAEKGDHFDFLLLSLLDIFGFTVNDIGTKIIVKSRFVQKEKKYEKMDHKNEFIIVNEKEAKFEVNLHDYLDTGLFLDHRPLRQLIKKESSGKKVLNLFSYTGAISVFAAIGGAKSVTSVDLSSTYQDWAKRNFLLNQLSLRDHNFLVDDILNYLAKPHPPFDLIILDPPTFSNSKKMLRDFDVEKDQLEVIDYCFKILAPNGTLYFSNNKRKFKLDLALTQKYFCQDITKGSIPFDFHDQKIHHVFKLTHQK